MTRISQRIIVGLLLLGSATLSPAQQQNALQTSTTPVPTGIKSVILNTDYIRAELSTLGKHPGVKRQTLRLPLPDGSWEDFVVHRNQLLPPDLAARFPEIQTFDGYNPKRPGENLKLDISPQGLHALILRPGQKPVFIDPESLPANDAYQSYESGALPREPALRCGVTEKSTPMQLFSPKRSLAPYASCELRRYRLAVAATAQYTAFHGGTVQAGLAAVATTVNRINGILERDIGITLQLVGNNHLLIYTNPNTQPYSAPGNPGILINENQTNLDAVIGSANYDIGHLLDKANSGGLAYLGSVCNNLIKAGGVSGSDTPQGDTFDVSLVAHEIGHQFNANHTQNNACNRNDPTAVEPGSGSTIMSYAGICSPNVQDESSAYYHGISLQEMGLFISGAGDACAVKTALPAGPVINGTTGGITVPANTPFTLTALIQNYPGATVAWEQMDNQITPQPPSRLATEGPNFRSQPPSSLPTRFFPSLANLAANTLKWEVLPSVSRTMNFRMTVRANSPGGSCNAYQDTTLTTNPVGGPFVVTWPSASNIVWLAKNQKVIQWDPANTQNAPINAATVNILLSVDGGQTYPYTLLTNVPNSGSAAFTMLNLNTEQARIMVIDSSGRFFAISPVNFTILTPLVHLDKADRNPMNYHEAYIKYSGLNLEPLTSVQLNGYPGGTIRLDAANNRFIIGNINTPRAFSVSVSIGFNDNTNQQSNSITIPGVV